MAQARVLNQSIAGRALPIGASVTPIHELANKHARDVLELLVFNDDDNEQTVQLHFNGVATSFKVPANDCRALPPLAFEARASDGTELTNKAISLQAATVDKISVMGRVSD